MIVELEIVDLDPSSAISFPDPTPFCGRGTRLMYNPLSGEGYFHKLFCGRWSCDNCARFKRESILRGLALVEGGIWAKVIDRGDTESFRKQVDRRHGDFMLIRKDGSALALATVQTAGADLLVTEESISLTASPWLETEILPWGRSKKVTRSRRWSGYNKEGNSLEKSEDDSPISEDGEVAMDQQGRKRELVFLEEPHEVSRVLRDLGTQVWNFRTGKSVDSSNEEFVEFCNFSLSEEALTLLNHLADGGSDPNDQLHLAWPEGENEPDADFDL